MNIHETIDTFGHYALQDKTTLLLHLAHALTILARDAYEVGGEGLTQPARLRRINELQHRLLSSVIALKTPSAKRYPDEVLVRIIVEHADDLVLQQQIRETLGQLMEQMAVST